MKLSALNSNHNNIRLGFNKNTTPPDADVNHEYSRPLQKAKTGSDKDGEDNIQPDTTIEKIVGNIDRQVGLVKQTDNYAPFKDITDIRKPPNLANI